MPPKKLLGALAILLAVAGPGSATAAGPNGYPANTVKVIVPYGAGGAIDIMARLISEQLQNKLKTSFIVENKTGAGGTVGADFVAKAPGDGYTLLFTAQGPLVMNPFLMKSLPYDPLKAFSPVTVVASAPNVLATAPSAPFKTLKELVASDKANPGSVTYGSQGVGTTGHVGGAMINQRMGLSLRHVPYKGFGPLYTDVVAGRVDVLLTDTFNIVPRIRSKELVGLAVASEKRSEALPDVPTFGELGYTGVVSGPWFSIVAPAGTPLEVRQFLASEVKEALDSPKVSERLKDFGTDVVASSPQEFEKFFKSEYERWGKAIKAADISVQ